MKFKQMDKTLKVGLILNIIFCILIIFFSILKLTVLRTNEQTTKEMINYYCSVYSLIACSIVIMLTILYMIGILKNKKIVGIISIFATLIPAIVILVAKSNNEENEDSNNP